MLFSIVIVTVALYLTFTFLFRKEKRFRQCLTAMPGPSGYPIVGSLFDMLQSPETFFNTTRKRNLQYYPIYKLDVLNLSAVNLVSPEDIELVLTDMKQITKSSLYNILHNWLGTGLLTSTGAKWQNRRKILTPGFHFNILQEFIKIFTEETNKLVEHLKRDCDKPFIDVLVPITHFTLLSIGETAMGINLDTTKNDKSTYKNAIYKIGPVFMYRAQRPWLLNNTIYNFTQNSKKEKILLKTLHDFSNSVIAERKMNANASYSTRKRLAMLDLLLKYRNEGANIDDEGIREEVDTFMFEGHDTTSIALCFGLMLLANHKEVQEKVYNEIETVLGEETPNYTNLHELKYLERCIKEILRLYPSVPFISRLSGSEINTKTGYIIPENCMVNVHIYDMHRNPNVFSDPEKFDPDRFLPENSKKRHPFAYIPFSAGPRNCIGQKFAMLEMKTALAGIIKNFSLEPVDTPNSLVLLADVVLRVKGSIKVKFVCRNT